MEDDRDVSRVSIVSIGEKLRKAREKKSLTIEQVQKETRIYSRILVALEEGRCDEILPQTYVRSFLKKYSNYLGLDSNEALKEYARVHPEEPLKSPLGINSVDIRRQDIFSGLIYVLSFVLLSAIILSSVIFLGGRLASVFKKTRGRKTAAVSARKAGSVTAPKVSARTKPSITEPAKIQAPQTLSAPRKAPFILVLNVKQPVQVQVKKDGKLLFKRVLPKGSLESFTADDRIELYVAKAEAIELILDGKSLGSPGKGLIKNLEITKKGITAR